MAQPKKWTVNEDSVALLAAVRELLAGGTEIPEDIRARLSEACETAAKPQGDGVPQGVVGIVMNPNGQVVVQHGDFGRHGYGGFTLKEAQTIRVKNLVKIEFAKRHHNEWIAAKVDQYYAETLFELAERAGYRLELVTVGYPDEGR